MQDKSPLFRPEAVTAKRASLEGRVAVRTPATLRWFALMVFAVVLGAITLISFGEYSRKQAALGQIVTSQAAARIVVREPGTVIDIPVAEGDRVEKGQVLARLRRGLDAEVDGSVDMDRVRSVRESIATVRKRLLDEQALTAGEADQLRLSRAALHERARALTRDARVHRERLGISRQQVDRATELAGSGIVSKSQLDDAKQALLASQLQLQSVESQLEQVRSEAAALDLQLSNQPAQAAARIAGLQLQLTELQQQLREAEDRESYQITAPITGVVSGSQAKPGETVLARSLLMTVLPESARYEAELFVPSRAIGFLREGQKVWIRYQAFPYQRFGLYTGTVASISGMIMAPAEVITTVPLGPEPVYRIKVALTEQTVNAYGQRFVLQPGMLIEADVELDRRPLWQWMLEPLLRTQGRL